MVDIEKLIYLIVAAVIIIVVILLGELLLEHEKDIMRNYETDCKIKCSKFNYAYYRIEDTSTYGRSNYNCWCITKDNSPIDIGSVKQ
jgi:hypothetical protein